MLHRAIFAGDMNMLADMNGRWCVGMDTGLALAWRLAVLTRVLIFLPALAMDMFGWAGLGFFAADIAGATATGRLPGLTMNAASGADLTEAAIADAAKS
jgi:hypothetical protein